MGRAHSFPRPAEFRAEPRNLDFRGNFTAENRGIWRFSFEQLFFSQKMTSKYKFVYDDFLFDGDGWIMKMMINEWIMKDS